MARLYTDPTLRADLCLYTRKVMTMLKDTPDLDVEDFLACIYEHGPQFNRCRGKSVMTHVDNDGKIKKVVRLCNAFVEFGACFCDTHKRDVMHNQTTLQYLAHDDGEFLYNAQTREVYTYSKKPTYIGRLDIEHNVIVFA